MTPEAVAFLVKADDVLERGQIMIRVSLFQDAARAAYLAAFHAAQAYIFERTQKIFKTHHGVQTEFARLTRDDPRADAQRRRFLSQAYEYKALADYGIGPGNMVSGKDANDAIAEAQGFVAHFRHILELPAI